MNRGESGGGGMESVVENYLVPYFLCFSGWRMIRVSPLLRAHGGSL